ncbi:Treacle Protein [Manis pentadactyla]|nr:Treacle Protein [Manis pentadactyla]
MGEIALPSWPPCHPPGRASPTLLRAPKWSAHCPPLLQAGCLSSLNKVKVESAVSCFLVECLSVIILLPPAGAPQSGLSKGSSVTAGCSSGHDPRCLGVWK